MKRIATAIFRRRVPLLLLLTLLTLFLGYHASRLEVGTDFARMIPLGHEYVQAYQPYKTIFGGGNQIRVSVSRKEGSVVTTDFLEKLARITEDVMFVKGIDRLTVRSLVSEEVRLLTVDEEGFNWGPVVPLDIPKTEEGLAKVRDNITMAQLRGWLVSMDMQSALITGEIHETGVDYLSVYRQLNEIRRKYSDGGLSIHINGFAMIVGFVKDALPKILTLFTLSVVITFFILYRCFRFLRLACLPLFSGGLSVLWTLGISSFMGTRLDPMTTIIPFLVFSVGVSHGIQMVKRYLEECNFHPEGYNAALHALAGLMVPGAAAMTTDVAGFLAIYLVPVGVVRDVALIASIGMACIILSDGLVLTLVLSYFPNLLSSEKAKPPQDQISPYLSRILTGISLLTYGRNAYRVAAVAFVLLLIGFFHARTVTVGDVNPGEPLLWEDSVYNTDAAKIMADYQLGIDWLSVVVAGDGEGTCKDYGILEVLQDYEWEMGSLPGTTVVISPLGVATAVNEMLHEGNMRWRALPKDRRELGYCFYNAGSSDDSEFMDMGCKSINIRVFLSDHKGDTIRRAIGKTKEFISDNPLSGARYVLAGGNAGVMAATNEVVGESQVPMLLLVYLSILVLCVWMFRSLKGSLLILAPLFLVSILSTAFMKLFNLGLNVNTLPVASLGVGIGVDFGIYVYSRLKEERQRYAHFPEAVNTTLHTTGAAVLYTASAKSVSVLIWLLSDLKFQADMGLLLGFIYIANLIGAVVVLPALVYLFDVKDKQKNGSESP